MHGPVPGIAVAVVVTKAGTDFVSAEKAFELVGLYLGASGRCPE